jgi:hypothetical protein
LASFFAFCSWISRDCGCGRSGAFGGKSCHSSGRHASVSRRGVAA